MAAAGLPTILSASQLNSLATKGNYERKLNENCSENRRGPRARVRSIRFSHFAESRLAAAGLPTILSASQLNSLATKGNYERKLNENCSENRRGRCARVRSIRFSHFAEGRLAAAGLPTILSASQLNSLATKGNYERKLNENCSENRRGYRARVRSIRFSHFAEGRLAAAGLPTILSASQLNSLATKGNYERKLNENCSENRRGPRARVRSIRFSHFAEGRLAAAGLPTILSASQLNSLATKGKYERNLNENCSETRRGPRARVRSIRFSHFAESRLAAAGLPTILSASQLNSLATKGNYERKLNENCSENRRGPRARVRSIRFSHFAEGRLAAAGLPTILSASQLNSLAY